jgi:flavin reductase (DIM6/NTAB) family NADH-FMN oxidoreductase RutF
MISFDPKEIPVGKTHALLLGAVTPRPIAFASTVDKKGNVNLSPFSFFNCFGANPPILVFSPASRVRNNTSKHTLDNVLEVPEVVINIVTYDIVQQASLASTDYPRGVNEFVKAAFTELPSTKVKPPRVAESPVQMECKVLNVIRTGEQGGAGNLVICEVIMIHVRPDIFDSEGRIDPYKLDAVARLGADYYARVNPQSIFKVPKPNERIGVGIDQLPVAIKTSRVFSGNDLAMLANVEAVPVTGSGWPDDSSDVHQRAKELLSLDKINEAWEALANADSKPNPNPKV